MKKGESRVKGNSLGASGFTLGLLSILSFGWFGLIMSVLGFAFCLVQQMKKPTKLAKAGLVLNVIGFILSILWITYFAQLFADWMQNLNALPSA